MKKNFKVLLYKLIKRLSLVINLNLSIVHTVGLHIPPTVLEYGTPVFNVNQDVNEKKPEWEFSE